MWGLMMMLIRFSPCISDRPPKVVRPLVVPHVNAPLLPSGGKAKVHEEEALFSTRARSPKEEVLGLDVAVDVSLCVECLEDRECLDCDACPIAL